MRQDRHTGKRHLLPVLRHEVGDTASARDLSLGRIKVIDELQNHGLNSVTRSVSGLAPQRKFVDACVDELACQGLRVPTGGRTRRRFEPPGVQRLERSAELHERRASGQRHALVVPANLDVRSVPGTWHDVVSREDTPRLGDHLDGGTS
jgi:hypothetical protein